MEPDGIEVLSIKSNGFDKVWVLKPHESHHIPMDLIWFRL